MWFYVRLDQKILNGLYCRIPYMSTRLICQIVKWSKKFQVPSLLFSEYNLSNDPILFSLEVNLNFITLYELTSELFTTWFHEFSTPNYQDLFDQIDQMVLMQDYKFETSYITKHKVKKICNFKLYQKLWFQAARNYSNIHE